MGITGGLVADRQGAGIGNVFVNGDPVAVLVIGVAHGVAVGIGDRGDAARVVISEEITMGLLSFFEKSYFYYGYSPRSQPY